MELENAYVRVLRGKTKYGAEITNQVFKLLAHIARDPVTQNHQNGVATYITVDGKGHSDVRQGNTRIYLTPVDYEMIDAAGAKLLSVANDSVEEVRDPRTDEEIAAELIETFEIVGEMTEATAKGVVKGLIISGPAGIGKSHTVENTLISTIGIVAKLQGENPKYDVVKGKLTPIMLYCTLYRYSTPGSVLVLDDADGILYDEECLNMLKAVLDTKKVRRVHWGSNSYILEKEGVPSSFDFQGGVIFLTNIKWDKARSERIANHLGAIMSRTHYLDVRIDTMRERILHIKNTVMNTDMLDEYNFTKADIQEIMDYVMDNLDRLSTVDLRTILKCADMKLAMPENWTKFADRSVCKNFRKVY